METDSLYLALAENNLDDCILPEKKAQWTLTRQNDCRDDFKAETTLCKDEFFPRTCCAVHKEHDRREHGLFKEEFRCTELLCLRSKTYYCYDSKSDKFKLTSKGLNERFVRRYWG